MLLPCLHAVQDSVGWISHGAINYISQRLGLGPAEAYGVATFYDLLSTVPTPERVAFVCDDIACKASGVDATLVELGERLGPDGIDIDGAMWKRSPCLGQCDKGSAAYIQVAGGDNCVVAPASVDQIIEILSVDHPHDIVVADATPQTPDAESLLLLAGTGDVDLTDLSEYRRRGGYRALARAVEIGPDAVIAEVTASGLRGRGGAAFPAGVKWQAVAAHEGIKYVVCNADESEPGTFKDRVVLETDPFAVIEALTIAGLAVGAELGYIYLRGEYPRAHRTLVAAIHQARMDGLLGAGVAGTDSTFDLEIRRGAGAYICGEETALFNSIEGFRGEPRQKPPYPTDAGLFGKPTVVNNVESLANIPSIVLNGGTAFARIGTPESTGPKLFCLSGNVAHPGLYEVPFGASVDDLIAMAGGPVGEIQAVLTGGAAGTFVDEEQRRVPLTFEDTRVAGVSLGSGVVMVFNTEVDLDAIVQRIAEFFGEESCGLCVPCRVGTVRQHESLVRLGGGSNADHELQILDELDAVLRDASICGLGQAASAAIQSAIALGLVGREAGGS